MLLKRLCRIFCRSAILHPILHEEIFWLHPTIVTIESCFLTPTDSSELFNIISSENLVKNDGQNSIPTRILKLLNKGIRSSSSPI